MLLILGMNNIKSTFKRASLGIVTAELCLKVPLDKCLRKAVALLILNDLTSQFYYKVNTSVRPYKKMAGGDMYGRFLRRLSYKP